MTAESGTDGSGKNYSKTYTLDEAGNRQKLVATLDASTTTTNYSYNDLDWMTQQSVVAPSSTTTTNYDYDANRSQTGITAQVGAAAPTYIKQVWDFEGHLTARGATDASGNWGNSRNEYSYDANGLRLSQSTVAQSGTTSAKTSYLWNGDRLLEERDKDKVLLARYEHGQELGPLSMLRPATSTIAAQTRYFIGDGQDSTRQLMDETGAVKDSYFYDSFGVDLSGGQQTSTNSFKYTGQQQDDSGLYYLRARYYEAGSGRFLSHDPEMGSSDDPISMHRYLYCGADGVNGVDPSGRESVFEVNFVNAINTGMGAVDAKVGFGVLKYAVAVAGEALLATTINILGKQNLDAWHDFEFGWVDIGSGRSRNRYYGDGTPEMESFARSPQADWLRNSFGENGNRSIPRDSPLIEDYSHFRGFFETVWHSSIFNYQNFGFHLGGYAGSRASAQNNGNGTVSYHLENDMSLHSLLPFIPNKVLGHDTPFWKNGPFSVVHETYEWTEPIDQPAWRSTDYRNQNRKYDGLIAMGDQVAETATEDAQRGIDPRKDPQIWVGLMLLEPQLLAASFDDGGGYD